jgi:CheY-like chemotaxis protein
LGHGIELTLEFPSDLPPILADANQLELALLNLALNARDAMQGGGKLSIAASAESQGKPRPGQPLSAGEYVRISIADTGTGMDDATLAKATEPFFTTKGPGKGTGLGLSMVHGLAAQSGGLLKIHSEPNVGTTIELWLPRATTSAVSVSRLQQSTEASPATTPCRVLIVDDDHLVMAGTSALVEDLGHESIEAHSAEEALTKLEAGVEIDLVITDHAMPVMTGLQLAALIQKRYPGLPIILATGYAELPSEPAAMGLLKLAKPCTQHDIAVAIHRAMRAQTAPSKPAAVAQARA